MENTRVLIVTPALDMGGAEKHVLGLTKNLTELNFHVDVMSSGGPYADELESKGIEHTIFPLGTKKWFEIIKTTVRMRKIIKNRNYDLIHVHAVTPTLMCWLASRGLGCKIVTSVHGLRSTDYKLAGKILTLLSDKIIAVSKSVRNDLVNNGTNKEKVIVVENGVDLTEFSYDTNRTNHQIINVATVGRLAPEKGHKYLIEAVSKLNTKEIKLYIIGGGYLEEELKELVTLNGLNQIVHFTGFIIDVPSLLKEMDIIVMPSLREGLPLAILESMAMGKAVIATNVGGIPELIIPNQTGILVQAANVEELVNSISYLIENPDIRYKLGDEAQKFIQEHFSIQKMVKEIIAVYYQALNKINLKQTIN